MGSAQKIKTEYSPDNASLGSCEYGKTYNTESQPCKMMMAQMENTNTEELKNDTPLASLMKVSKQLSNNSFSTAAGRHTAALKVRAATSLLPIKAPKALVDAFMRGGPPSDEWIRETFSEVNKPATRSRSAAPKSVDGEPSPVFTDTTETDFDKFSLALGQISNTLTNVIKLMMQSNPSMLDKLEKLEAITIDPINIHIFGELDSMCRSKSTGYYLLHFLGGTTTDKPTYVIEATAELQSCAKILGNCQLSQVEELMDKMSIIMSNADKSSTPEVSMLGLNFALDGVEKNPHLNVNNILSSKIGVLHAHNPKFSMFDLQSLVSAMVAKLNSKANASAFSSRHGKIVSEPDNNTLILTQQIAQLQEQLAEARLKTDGTEKSRRSKFTSRPLPSADRREEMKNIPCKRGKYCPHLIKGTCWFSHSNLQEQGSTINSVAISTDVLGNSGLKNATSIFGNCLTDNNDFYDSDDESN